MRRLEIPRVVKMPVEVQATEALRESIITGAIPAGARITEAQISEQIHISRATIRILGDGSMKSSSTVIASNCTLPMMTSKSSRNLRAAQSSDVSQTP